MNTNWSLDNLYKGFDDPQYAKDEKKLSSLIEKFTDFSESMTGDPAAVVKEGLLNIIDIQNTATMLLFYPALRREADTSDYEAAAASERIYKALSKTAKPETLFSAYVASVCGLNEIIEGDPLLKEHEFYLNELKEGNKYKLSPDVEEVMSLMQLSGSSAWENLRSYVTSTVPVEVNGKSTNLSDIRNMAYDPDPKVRHDAYYAELASYDRIKDAVAYSLNSIKLEVINECRLRGYASPMEQTLKKSRMKQETLDALLTAIEEALPKFWEYMRAKARLLGYKDALPFYELFAPLPGNEKVYTTEDARDYLVELFSGFDKEEADMIKGAFDNEWIDFFPRDGKTGGAFCEDIHPIHESRILTNFGGTLGDVITLAHELGHAFHNYCMRDNSILNIDVSMPVAETASTFNEVVAMNAAISAEKDLKTRRALIESQISDANQIICDIYSRYLFEKAVFDNREAGFMGADKLCEIMLDAQKKAYGTGLDHELLHPYMWVCKSHYYYAGLSYYNWPYAFGGLFARGLYAKYLNEGPSFVPLYKKLLKATGTTDVEGAALVADIDLTDVEFWRSSMKILSDEIDEFLELCKM